MRKWLMAFLLLAGTAGVRAQQCDVPQIGAQVFVEPGQTPEDIDGFFRLLHDNGMKVARIRMFGAGLRSRRVASIIRYCRAARKNRSIICRGITGETTTSMEVCSSRQTVFWENREI